MYSVLFVVIISVFFFKKNNTTCQCWFCVEEMAPGKKERNWSVFSTNGRTHPEDRLSTSVYWRTDNRKSIDWLIDWLIEWCFLPYRKCLSLRTAASHYFSVPDDADEYNFKKLTEDIHYELKRIGKMIKISLSDKQWSLRK